MKTIELTLTVQEDRKATVQLPEGVEPGTHRAVLMIEEPTGQGDTGRPLVLHTYDVGPLDPSNTFRREDLYDDDGR